VYHITTSDQSRHYGAGAQWPISGRRDNDKYFDLYRKQGEIYIVINKSNKDDNGRQEKYFVLAKDGKVVAIYDNHDNQIKSIPNGPKGVSYKS
jgi:hypothetical protein